MAKINPAMALPPLISAAIGALFYFGLYRDNADQQPSALAGKPAPEVNLIDLGDSPAPSHADFVGDDVTLINFWASWCAPCRAEHGDLMQMQENGIKIIGINYKDEPQNALDFLAQLGNPFEMIGADPTGRNAIEWGVTAVPETFILNSEGRIIHRFPGPIVGKAFETQIAPAIERARQSVIVE